jgi:hypothetical protein
MVSWLCGVVVLIVAYVSGGGSLSLEEGGLLAFIAAVMVYALLGVDTIYRLARHREVYQWQLRPFTRVLIVVVCLLLVFFIAGVTNAPGLALLLVVPLLPVMLGLDRYVRRNKSGMSPVDGSEVSQ